MSYIPYALGAYVINSVAVLVDKYLLVENIPNPLAYIFYISCFSLFVLIFLPFVGVPTFLVFILVSLSTILWTFGAYCMFSALRVGLASRVIPVIGALVPVILLLHAIIANSISLFEAWAVLMLIGGIVFLTLPEWKGKVITRQEMFFEVFSAILFSISYIVLRAAYETASFLLVLAWSRVILVPIIIIILVVPVWRRIVTHFEGKRYDFRSKHGLLFLGGQLGGGASELLLTFSISLANPALVNSLQGIQYGFLYVMNVLLSKRYPKIFHEETKRWIVVCKSFGLLLVAFGLVIIGVSH